MYIFPLVQLIGLTGVVTVSFAIITTTAITLLQSIGVKRMPVILSSGYEKEWIKSTKHLSEVLGMLTQFTSEKINAYPVSDLVNVATEKYISMITPMGKRLQIDQQQPNTKPVPTIIRKINIFTTFTFEFQILRIERFRDNTIVDTYVEWKVFAEVFPFENSK